PASPYTTLFRSAPAPRRSAARTTVISSLGRRVPSPATTCGSHYHHRSTSSLREVAQLLRRFPTVESLQQLAFLLGQPRRRQQIRPLAPREPDRLHPAPALDPRVVPREQHGRHPRAPVGFGPRVRSEEH